jgi:hypothetical protein
VHFSGFTTFGLSLSIASTPSLQASTQAAQPTQASWLNTGGIFSISIIFETFYLYFLISKYFEKSLKF